ncbi:MAG: EAL domain-containing protein [Thiohalophilus sp.]|nr:EAL domain-containing protein [Thiohalophilus sp.]
MNNSTTLPVEELYNNALNSLGEGVIIIDPEGRVVWMNRQAELMLGWQGDELSGVLLHDAVHYQKSDGSAYSFDECDIYLSLKNQVLRRNIDDVFTRKDSKLIPVSHVTTPMLQDGKLIGLTLAFHDITERKKAEKELRLQSTALSSAANAVFITDKNGNIEWVNKAFEKMSGFSGAEVLGKNPRVLNSGQHEEDYYRHIWSTILSGEVWRGELVERHKDGHFYTVEQVITPIIESGRITHFVAIHEDISENKQAQERIRYMALYDVLTGLPNRAYMREHLEQALASADRNEKLLGVMFLDLDRFKFVNDSLGHNTGDKLLQQVASRLRRCVRRSDTVARFGGDEFVIIQSDIEHIDNSATMIEKIVNELSRPFSIEGNEVHTGVCIGVTIYPFDDGDADALLKHADMAMYRAKSADCNSCQFFDMDMQKEMERRIALDQALRQAILQNQLYLVYQPQININTRGIVGVEALIRWEHPECGDISPGEFIPIAESTGIIREIGEWVLSTACKQAAEWKNKGFYGFRIGVNVSVYQLRDSSFVQTVDRILNKYNISGQCLELELTESMLMDNVKDAISTIQGLHDLGISLAIDDFGTGYSSLSYLNQLPVHRIKLDRSFVKEIDTNVDSGAIAGAVVQLGHSLGLDVLAEGVEREEQLYYLQNLGCDTVQGFYLCQPLKSEEFEQFLMQQVHIKAIS